MRRQAGTAAFIVSTTLAMAAGLEEERLDERRLSRPAVTDDADVADLGGLGHGRSVFLRASTSGREA